VHYPALGRQNLLILYKALFMISTTDLDKLKASVRNVPDFPHKGIQFKDITTVVKNPELFSLIVDGIASHYVDKNITKVVAVESRGFISGGALACKLGAGFVPVRKAGKLPADTYSETYDLEYGKDAVEIHKDALQPDDIVLLHDDLLATGGTSLAVIKLLSNFDVRRIYISFIIELDFLKGRSRLSPPYEVYTLIHY
jgi:adenine phosphoribosyltransferase